MIWILFFVIYEDNIFTNPKNPVNIEAILNSLNNVSRGEQRGRMGHNLEKYCIGLFHVSEHLGHF